MVDLSFTKNPDWIAQRQAQWKGAMEEHYSEDHSRRQREAIRQYFLTGLLPEKNNYMGGDSLLRLFPLQTPEGYCYVFENYIEPEYFKRDGFWFVDGVLFTNKKYGLAWCTDEESDQLISFFLGSSYDPEKYFPFKLKGEVEYRKCNWPLHRIISLLASEVREWISVPSVQFTTPAIHYLDYLFSAIKQQDPFLLRYDIPDRFNLPKDDEERDRVKDIILRRETIARLFRAVFLGYRVLDSDLVTPEKRDFIINLYGRIEALAVPEYPQELIDHWSWIKRRKEIFEYRFSVDENYDCERVIQRISIFYGKELNLDLSNEYSDAHKFAFIYGFDITKLAELLKGFRPEVDYCWEVYDGIMENNDMKIIISCVSDARVFKTLCQQLQINMSVQSSSKMNRQLRQRQIPILHRMRPAL